MNTRKHIITSSLVAGALLFCGLSFADNGQSNGKGQQVQPGNNGSQQGNSVRIRIALTGTIINGRTAEGKAEYRAEQGRQELEVEAENVALPDGTRSLPWQSTRPRLAPSPSSPGAGNWKSMPAAHRN